MQEKLGTRIKQRRKELGLSAEYVAQKIGVNYTTIYRYESSSIEKIPVEKFDQLCKALSTTPAVMMGNGDLETVNFPKSLSNAKDAMEFMIKQPVFAEYGGYNPEQMSDKEIIEFANEILHHLQLVSYKYKNEEEK